MEDKIHGVQYHKDNQLKAINYNTIQYVGIL